MNTPVLTGPEQPLTGHVEPRNDEVIAVFRNGKLVDLRAPGKRARALFLKYRPGSLTYARILRSDIAFDNTVTLVRVSDGWVLPSVQVTTLVALNDEDDYGALRDRLVDRGLGFSTALTEELAGEMDRFVRRLVSPMTHAGVIDSPTPDHWGHAAELLSGLFVVDSVHVKAAVPDPQYVEMHTAKQGLVVDEALNARALANARARDLSLQEYENPQALAQRKQQEHELELARLTTGVEMQRITVESERDRLLLKKAELEANATVLSEAMRNTAALTRGNNAEVLANLVNRGFGGSIEAPAPPVTVDAEAPLPAPTSGLGRDPGLLDALRRAGGPGKSGVRGLVRVVDDGAALVLLVLAPGVDPADLPTWQATAFPGDDVVVLPAEATLVDWVTTLVDERAPHAAALQPVWTLHEDDGELQIQVGSRGGRPVQVVKAVQAPHTLVVPALAALLPYDDVTCTPALR